MKLSDFLNDVGRPVAYYPGLRRVTGSTNATILLCQLIYWTGKQANRDGWIFKTSDELEEETGLSWEEQKTAREKLTARGLLEENYARLEHKMYFRVILTELDKAWEIPQSGVAGLGNQASPNSTNQALPDSNPENTQETTLTGADAPKNFPVPLDWQIALGEEKIELLSSGERETYAFYAHQYSFGAADCEPYLIEAQVAAGRAMTKAEASLWRKDVRVVIEEGYTPQQLGQAIREHVARTGKDGRPLPFKSPGSAMYLLRAGVTVQEPVHYAPALTGD